MQPPDTASETPPAGHRYVPVNRAAVARLVEDVAEGRITHLDGTHSPLSQRLRSVWKCDEFQMDANWVLLPQDWQCLCCSRSKFEISRVGAHKRILAKIVAHHDHMLDVPSVIFDRAFKGDRTGAAYTTGRALAYSLYSWFCAFDDVLICEDCNNADTKAAKLVHASKHFSFSVEQIRQFIEPAPHQRHSISEERLRAVWSQAKSMHEHRMAVMNALLEGALRGCVHVSSDVLAAHNARAWYVGNGQHDVPRPAPPSYWRDEVDGEFAGQEVRSAICQALNVPSNAQLAEWRTLPLKSVRLPAPREIERALLRDEERRNSVPRTWHCPICCRSKASTVFVEKDGDTRCGTAEYWRPGMGPPPIPICLHCARTLEALKRELKRRTGLTGREINEAVSTERLQAIIIPRDHAVHQIHGDRARELVEGIVRQQR